MMIKDTVTIEMALAAPIEKVWQAWTDPAHIHWFGSDPNGKVVNAILDVRPGGFFEVTFRDGDATEHTCSGFYTEVQPVQKLSFTWTWKSEPGVETLVTLRLSPEGNTTQMYFEHARLGTASMHNYLAGWKSTFLKLEQMLGISQSK